MQRRQIRREVGNVRRQRRVARLASRNLGRDPRRFGVDQPGQVRHRRVQVRLDRIDVGLQRRVRQLVRRIQHAHRALQRGQLGGQHRDVRCIECITRLDRCRQFGIQCGHPVTQCGDRGQRRGLDALHHLLRQGIDGVTASIGVSAVEHRAGSRDDLDIAGLGRAKADQADLFQRGRSQAGQFAGTADHNGQPAQAGDTGNRLGSQELAQRHLQAGVDDEHRAFGDEDLVEVGRALLDLDDADISQVAVGGQHHLVLDIREVESHMLDVDQSTGVDIEHPEVVSLVLDLDQDGVLPTLQRTRQRNLGCLGGIDRKHVVNRGTAGHVHHQSRARRHIKFVVAVLAGQLGHSDGLAGADIHTGDARTQEGGVATGIELNRNGAGGGATETDRLGLGIDSHRESDGITRGGIGQGLIQQGSLSASGIAQRAHTVDHGQGRYQ